jgi:hypothetical protein
MAKLWVIEFAVQSKNKLVLQFPIDMLRYDSCYPANDQYSVIRIVDSLDQNISAIEFDHKPINLIHNSHGNKNWSPTAARWESFGYRVINIKCSERG